MWMTAVNSCFKVHTIFLSNFALLYSFFCLFVLILKWLHPTITAIFVNYVFNFQYNWAKSSHRRRQTVFFGHLNLSLVPHGWITLICYSWSLLCCFLFKITIQHVPHTILILTRYMEILTHPRPNFNNI